MDLNQLLTLALGGGLVATITALFNGIKSLREGSRSRERDTIRDLVEQRKEAWQDRDEAIDQRDYWRNRAGLLEYLCNSNGVAVPSLPPMPTKEISNERTHE